MGVAQHEDQLDPQLSNGELETPQRNLTDHVSGYSNNKKGTRALRKNGFDGNSGIRAPKDCGEGGLAGGKIGEGQRGVLRSARCGGRVPKAPVSFSKSMERF